MSETLHSVLDIIFEYRECFKECDYLAINNLLLEIKSTTSGSNKLDDEAYKNMEYTLFLHQDKIKTLKQDIKKYIKSLSKQEHMLQVCKYTMKNHNIEFPSNVEQK